MNDAEAEHFVGRHLAFQIALLHGDRYMIDEFDSRNLILNAAHKLAFLFDA